MSEEYELELWQNNGLVSCCCTYTSQTALWIPFTLQKHMSRSRGYTKLFLSVLQ